MNTTLSKVLIFAAGAAIGSVVTYMLVEKKIKDEYEQRLADDTASIKEAFAEANFPDSIDETAPVIDIQAAPKTSTLTSILHNLDYIADSDEETTTVEKKAASIENAERPEVINPCDYGEYYDYDTETLYYYADDILADDMDNVVEDVEGTVGSYALTTFGKYEDDAVHVRNDMKQRYYEILRSECKYSEKYGFNLHEKED